MWLNLFIQFFSYVVLMEILLFWTTKSSNKKQQIWMKQQQKQPKHHFHWLLNRILQRNIYRCQQSKKRTIFQTARMWKIQWIKLNREFHGDLVCIFFDTYKLLIDLLFFVDQQKPLISAAPNIPVCLTMMSNLWSTKSRAKSRPVK